MKKIITITALLLGFSALSQKDETRKFQAGLSIAEGIVLNNSGTDLISSPGVGNDFSVGVNGHYHITPFISFSSGIIFDFQTFRYTASTVPEQGGNLFYVYSDRRILKNEDFTTGNSDFDPNASYTGIFRLDERKHRPVYLSIPTMLTFNTKVYGYMRYFGRAGIRNSFNISNKSNDTGEHYELNPQGNLVPTGEGVITKEDMEPDNEFNFYKGAIGVSGGFEWKFSGNVSLVGEVSYFHGFTQLFRGDAVIGHDDKNKSLFNQDNTNNSLIFRNFDAKQQQLMLKFSLLF